MPRKTVLLCSAIAAAALTASATAQDASQPRVYGDYAAPASTVDANYNSVEAEAEAIRRYQQSQQSAAPVTGQTYQYPLAKTYATREDALADIQIEIFDTPIAQGTARANEVTYGTAYTQSANATTTVETPTYTYTAPMTTTTTNFSSGSAYTVIQGDTLYSIGRKYGLKASDVMNANGLTGSNISIGQVLTIPGIAAAPSSVSTYAPTYTQSVTTASSPAAAGTTIVRNIAPLPLGQAYAVLPGDTLYSISRRSCVTPSAIASVSGIAVTDTITPGQMLTLPNGHCAK